MNDSNPGKRYTAGDYIPGGVYHVPPESQTAQDILGRAREHLVKRASFRDLPQGERSMKRTVAAFNAMYGTQLTEVQGWQFMVLLKMSRASVGLHNPDDYEDQAAYAALAGESANPSNPNEVPTDA